MAAVGFRGLAPTRYASARTGNPKQTDSGSGNVIAQRQAVRQTILFLVISGCLVAGSTGSRGQAQDSQDAFRSTADLVAVSVTATDVRQQVVGDLSLQNFIVFEDGVRQAIAYFAPQRVPLDLAILIDQSTSMSPHVARAQEAAIGLVRTLQAGDRAMVMGFHDRVDLLYPLGDRIPEAIDAIRRTRAFGGTAIYNALYIAMSALGAERERTPEIRRQAIAVLSDGRDTTSLLRSDDVLVQAAESGIAVYPIVLVLPSDSAAANSDSVWIMKSIARDSGARAFVTRSSTEFAEIYDTIANELAHQYMLGYYSTNRRRDGAFRRIDVRVVGRDEAVARTRPGYFAPRR